MRDIHPEVISSQVTLDRVLSKLGYCSRTKALHLIQAGRVKINGCVERKVTKWIDLNRDRISVDEKTISKVNHIYLMLNKPRGLVTTMSDEKDRATVYQCFNQTSLPRLIPVGRLDKASEGLLLFTNDTAWANQITDPASHLDKIYHVQIDGLPNDTMIEKMIKGIKNPQGEILRAKQVKSIRTGKKTSWLEIILDEGKNRQIRRILESMEVNVLRLIRIAIGPLRLGNLAKGQFRPLAAEELKIVHEVLNHLHQNTK